MKPEEMGLVVHQEYLWAALLVSLLSVWALLGLLFYLRHYLRRDYFSMWTASWLFYALWLTLSVRMGDPGVGSITFTIKQCFLSTSAVFLLWGSLRFLGHSVGPWLIGSFMLFLVVWIFVSTQVMLSVLLVEFPVFLLLSLSTPVAGLCIVQLFRRKEFLAAGMLSLGFLLLGIYFGSYPFSRQYGHAYNALVFGASVLQFLLVAVMIVLAWDSIQARAEQARAATAAAPLEKIPAG